MTTARRAAAPEPQLAAETFPLHFYPSATGSNEEGCSFLKNYPVSDFRGCGGDSDGFLPQPPFSTNKAALASSTAGCGPSSPQHSPSRPPGPRSSIGEPEAGLCFGGLLTGNCGCGEDEELPPLLPAFEVENEKDDGEPEEEEAATVAAMKGIEEEDAWGMEDPFQCDVDN
jgi:hypothetical protein